MKRYIIRAIIFILLVLPGFKTEVKAADISIGATAWYTAWDYDWEGTDDVKYDPALLYGPVLSVTMTPRTSLSFVFLYGEFDMDVSSSSDNIPIKRYDSDLLLNYRIGEYLKIFTGLKYIMFTWSEDGKHEALGPGLGISSVIPAGGNFYILGYVSVIYLRGKEEGENNSQRYSVGADEYGFNTSISVAYYIPSASVSITLGGRYQQVNMKYDPPEPEIAEDSVSRFYGVTIAAQYSFGI